MYILRVKSKSVKLQEDAAAYATEPIQSGTMVRTQLYLTEPEHAFVQAEGRRLGKPMAAVIRDWIDEKMTIPDGAYDLLLAPPADPDFEIPEDAGINHDHYVYGGPKKYKKVKGKWVHLPMLP